MYKKTSIQAINTFEIMAIKFFIIEVISIRQNGVRKFAFFKLVLFQKLYVAFYSYFNINLFKDRTIKIRKLN